MAESENPSGTSNVNTLLAFIVGGLLVAVIVLFAFNGLNQTPPQENSENGQATFEDRPDVNIELQGSNDTDPQAQ